MWFRNKYGIFKNIDWKFNYGRNIKYKSCIKVIKIKKKLFCIYLFLKIENFV